MSFVEVRKFIEHLLKNNFMNEITLSVKLHIFTIQTLFNSIEQFYLLQP